MAGSTRVIGNLVVNVAANLSPLNAGVQSARGQFRSLNSQAPQTLSALSGISAGFLGVAGGAVAAALAVGKMVNTSREFAKSMATSTAIMGDVSAELRAQLEKTAKQVSFETKFSASEAAKAYYYLASAGFTAQQSMAALPVVARFAQAGMFDLEQATLLATTAQSAMGLKVADVAQNQRNLTRVTDVLTKASIMAQGTIEQFSLALTNKAAGALRIYGKDVEEGVAVLAAFQDQGMFAEEAGTALNIVMREFATRSLKKPEAFAQMGIDIWEANGAMRNLGDIVVDFEKKLEPLTAKGRKQFLLDLGFQDKSVSFIQTLIGSGAKIQQYEAQLRSAGGYTAEVAEKNLPAFERALNKLRAAFDNLATNIGTPALEKFGGMVLFVVDALQRQNTNVVQVTAKMITFAGAFIAGLAIFPKVIAGVNAIIKVLRGLASAQAIVTALSGPGGILVLAASLAAGTAAVVALDAAFEGMQSKVADAQESSGGLADAAKKDIKAIQDEADAAAEAIDKPSKAALKAQQHAADQLAADAKRITESVRTPGEVAADTIAHLNELVEQGAITWETYRRAVTKANDEMSQAMNKDMDRGHHDNAAVTRGSTAAFSAIQKSQDEMARLVRVADQQLKAQNDANDLLTKIQENTRREPVTIKKASI